MESCVGRPTGTGSSGLGDTAAYIPAGGGPVREANSASRTVRCAPGVCGGCASARRRLAECRLSSVIPFGHV